MSLPYLPSCTMSDLDYNKLLKRVSGITSTKIVDEERFKVPNADIFYEGNTTVFKNFDKVADILNREAIHLLWDCWRDCWWKNYISR